MSMLTIEHQRSIVLTARFGCDDRTANRFAEEVETLARQHAVLFSTRNKVRQELKSQGYVLTPRTR